MGTTQAEEPPMEQKPVPHVLIFPLQAQGHVNSMLKLAELLCLAGLHVTFLNNDRNHQRLHRFTDAHTSFARFHGFRFETINDVLPDDHPRSGDILDEMIDSINIVMKPLFREIMISGRLISDDRPPVTCIIADGIFGFAIDVAKELGIPIISFRTISACCVWAYLCLPKLIEAGELPFKEDTDMDRQITCVPGMEGFLRRRDLPSFCRAKELTDKSLQLVLTETLNSTRASAFILNTFEDLDGPILSQIRSPYPILYTLGPLHALLNSRRSDSAPCKDSSASVSSNSLWEVDRSCLTWLDSQPSKSILYVSFGSFAVMTRDELLEFCYGLLNSGKSFLWVIRTESITGEEEDYQIPAELVEAIKERGYMVAWAPQEEVLTHPAVGGFLTHSGWNSTLESIFAGVPMICWPYFADQQINSRFVSQEWRVGLDMKDKCDRSTVEKMVRDLMDDRREEFIRSADKIAEMARNSVSQGGSSYRNLEALIDDIRSMSIPPLHT